MYNKLFKLTKLKTSLLIIYVSIILITEIISKLFPEGIYSIILSYLFFLNAYTLFSYFIYKLVKQIIDDFKQHNYILNILFILVLLIYISFIFGITYSDIWAESNTELYESLQLFKLKDFGYNSFIYNNEYPARELILFIPILKLFGIGICTTHLCFAISFLIGICNIYLSVRKYLKINNINKYYALIPIYSLFLFPYIIDHYLMFEQTILPVSFTMIMISCFINLTIDRLNIIYYIESIFLINYLANSYYPSWLTLGLYIGITLLFLILVYFKKVNIQLTKPDIKLIIKLHLVLLFYSITNIILIIIYQGDPNNKYTINNITNSNILKILKDTLYEFWFTSYFLGFISIIVLIYLILSLLNKLTKYDIIISIWILCSILISFIINQNFNSINFTFYRIIVICPILCIVIPYHIIMTYKINLKLSYLYLYIGICFISFLLLFSHNNNNAYENNYEVVSSKYAKYSLLNITNQYNINQNDDIIILTEAYAFNMVYFNKDIQLKLFFPNATVYFIDELDNFNEMIFNNLDKPLIIITDQSDHIINLDLENHIKDIIHNLSLNNYIIHNIKYTYTDGRTDHTPVINVYLVKGK